MATQSANMGMSVTSYDAAALAQSITNAADGRHPHYGRNDGPPGAISAEEVDEGRYVHPDSRAMYQKCGPTVGNFCRYMPIYGPAIESYGPRFIFTLDLTQFLSKGIAYVLIATCLNPMFKRRFLATTLEYQRYYVVSRMGWSIKPFTALLADAFAIFGFKKRWILSGSSLVGFACSLVFAFLPATHDSNVPGAVMAFLVGYGQANIDILSEGLYARKIREHPGAGPDLVSSVWVAQMIASMVASVSIGPLTDNGLAWVGLIICGSCMALCFPFLVLNWMEEDKNRVERLKDHRIMSKRSGRRDNAKPDELEVEPIKENRNQYTVSDEAGLENALPAEDIEEQEEDEDEELYIPTYCGGAIEFNKEVIVRNWRISVFSIIMTVVVASTAAVSALYDGPRLYGVAFGGMVLLIGLLFWTLPPVVAKAGLYSFLNNALYLNFTSPMEGFLLENDACDSSYPQFDYTFYNTVSGVVGYLAGLAGVVAFSFIFSKRSYRITFIVTVFIYILASIFDLIMVQRWNLPAIPDHYFYIFGDSVVYQMAYMLNWMPMCVLLAQLCPRGSEAMVYALLAAISNHGQTIASIVGALLIQYVWKVDTATCNFGDLWKLIVLGHCALPALQLITVWFLIPGTRVCDSLETDGTSTRDQQSSAQEFKDMERDSGAPLDERASHP